MKEYTVKDLFTVMKRDVPVKHIVRNIYLIHNHIVDWNFDKTGSASTVTYILTKGWHLARLI